jgi:hypothetical protein
MTMEFPARPMLGCIGVAPEGDFAPTSGPSGAYGGNIDYNRIGQGATVYLPVYHPGGLLFLGGRASLSDGGYQSSILADLIPTRLPEGKGTFHRDFTGEQLTPEGARSTICRLDDDPAKNAARWKAMPQMANYQDVGDPKPGATTLLVSAPSGKRKEPLLSAENYGRGRTVLLASGGIWRWRMWLPHEDKSEETFWQQMFRHLVTDSPSQVRVSTPKSVISDDMRVPIRVEVRDKEYKPVILSALLLGFVDHLRHAVQFLARQAPGRNVQ